MTDGDQHDAWSAGRSYDHYMGRWSRAVASLFVAWLDQPGGLDWVDVGCGTGALSATVIADGAPRSVVGIDPSEGFVQHARDAVADTRARFEVATAEALPLDDKSVDVVTSGLAYNFVHDRPAALREFRRVARPGATISFCVWDYPGGGIGFIDAFWKAAVSVDPNAKALDEASRFPFCTADTLRSELNASGLRNAEVEPIEVATRFDDFESFWYPFTLGAGPAPGYLISLDDDARNGLRQRLRAVVGDGPIELTARAWALRALCA